MVTFVDIIYNLEQIGVADVLLPFFLIFVITYAILGKTKILGDSHRGHKFNFVVALVMGLAVVIPHVLGRYPPGGDIVLIINSALPQVAVVILGILMLLLMIGAFGYEWQIGASNGPASLVVILSVGVIIAIFGSSAGWFRQFPAWLYFLNDPQTQSLLITLLVFGVVTWLITREPSENRSKDDSNWTINLEKLNDSGSKKKE